MEDREKQGKAISGEVLGPWEEVGRREEETGALEEEVHRRVLISRSSCPMMVIDLSTSRSNRLRS